MGGMLPYVIICENVKKLAHYTKKSWYTFPFRGFELQKFPASCRIELHEWKLTHFMPLISFDTLWKHQKTSGFLMFSAGIKRDQWYEMG